MSEINLSFTVTLDRENPEVEELLAMCASYPHYCPSCNFTHDSALWVRKDENFVCSNCGYILKENDCWDYKFD